MVVPIIFGPPVTVAVDISELKPMAYGVSLTLLCLLVYEAVLMGGRYIMWIADRVDNFRIGECLYDIVLLAVTTARVGRSRITVNSPLSVLKIVEACIS